jgi:hypothetical protein
MIMAPPPRFGVLSALGPARRYCTLTPDIGIRDIKRVDFGITPGKVVN